VSDAATTRRVVLAFIDALNAGDPDGIAGLVAEDFFNEHTSSLGNSLRGRDAYRQRLPLFLGQFTDLHYEVEDVLVDGDRAAVAYTMTFDWGGEDGTVQPVRIRGVFRFRVADGHIAHRVDYWDGADFQRQTTPSGGTS
jgi:steroid delta-isomerase-like uncharacterized protein